MSAIFLWFLTTFSEMSTLLADKMESYSSAGGVEAACSSAPCLKISEQKRKKRPDESETVTEPSNSATGNDSSMRMPTTIPVKRETATEMMIEVIPRRKLSLALSKVKGVPACKTLRK